MSTVTPSWSFFGIDDKYASNVYTDEDGTVIAAPPDSAVLQSLIRAMNHLAIRHRHIMMNMHTPIGILHHDGADRTPMHLLRWLQKNPYAAGWLNWRVIAMKKDNTTSTGQTSFKSDLGVGEEYMTEAIDGTTPAEEIDVQIGHGAWIESFINAADTDKLETYDGLRPISVAMYGARVGITDLFVTDPAPESGTNQMAQRENLFPLGSIIKYSELREIARSIHNLWCYNRRQFVAWSAAAHSTGIFDGNNVMWHTGNTTFSNAIDVSVTGAPTDDTPGFHCPIKYCGLGNTTVVPVRCAVYAKITAAGGGAPASTGEVKFQSRNTGNTQTLAISSTTGAWVAGGTILNLGDCTTNEYDKIDVYIRPLDAGDKIWVAAISVYEDFTAI